jgi:hypothetical protein
MGRREQVLELFDLAFFRRPEQEMEMVPHDFVRRNSDVGTVLRPSHQTKELLVISRTLKQDSFVVAAIDDVIEGTGRQITQRAGHLRPPRTVRSKARTIRSRLCMRSKL